MNQFSRYAAALALTFPSIAFADFKLAYLTLGMPEQAAQQTLGSACSGNCMLSRGFGPGGLHSVTVYLKYQTIAYANTREEQVNRSRPYESITVTFGPDQTVVGLRSDSHDIPAAVADFTKRLTAQYEGKLHTFTTQLEHTLVSSTADIETNHDLNMYGPEFSGRRFEASSWPLERGLAYGRVQYIDFDAIQAIANHQDNIIDFEEVRTQRKVFEPRQLSSVEINALEDGQNRAVLGDETRVSAHGITVEVVNLDDENKTSKVLVNGHDAASASFREDGFTYTSISPLAPGFFWVGVASTGNSCYAQSVQVLRVTPKTATMLPDFGRCLSSVDVRGPTAYFSFEATEGEPAYSVAID